MDVTLVTALYNINRENDGDGRKWDDYLQWFKITLQHNSPMVIFVPKELTNFVKFYRKVPRKTFLKVFLLRVY
jgi:hypothetical protein